MLDRFATWLFRHFRRRYLVALEVSCSLFVSVAVGVLSVATIGHFVKLSSGELAICATTVAVLAAFANRVGIAVRHRQLQVVRQWLRGDDVEREAVRHQLLVMLTGNVISTMAVQVPLHGVISVAVMARYGHFDAAMWFGTELALVGVLLWGAIVVLQAYQVLLRPAIAAVTAELPADAVVSTEGLSIAARLAMGIFVAALTCGAASVLWAGRTGAPSSRFAIGMVAAVVFTLYLTALSRVGLIDAALAPLRDVVDATVRVRAGDFSTPVTITTADELGELAAAFNDMQRGLREREALHSAFGSYVDPALARRLLDQGDSVFEGEEIDASVFFADIRDFTRYAENASVRDAVSTLNRFFSIVVRVISDHGGHTNAYLGDGVLAVFGTPLPLDDHADRAVAAALSVLERVHAEFGDALRIGIGVNTGRVIAGTVGGEGKLEFTVIGDPVNVAARVEQLTKQTGDAVLITDATRAALTQPPAAVLARGEFEVRGKQHRVQLFGVA